MKEIEQVLGVNHQTKFAIEEALWDLMAKKLQTPAVNLIGSTAGSQLLEALQLHFCASLPDLFGGTEISEFESLTNDPASGLTVEHGMLKLPTAHGLGVKINPAKLREATGFSEAK